MIVNLLTNELDPPPADLLQKMFCEFVGEVQTDSSILAQLHKADILQVLISLFSSPCQIVRDFSKSLLSSVQDHTKETTTYQHMTPDSVARVVDSLVSCEKNDLTQNTLCGLINTMFQADDDAKDQLCQTRNMDPLVQLLLEATSSRDDISTQAKSSRKLFEGYPAQLWNAQGLLGTISNALGGSIERQQPFVERYGQRVGSRLVQLLDWFRDSSPKRMDGKFNNVICAFFYKVSARTKEGRVLLYDVGSITPLLHWAKRALDFFFKESSNTPNKKQSNRKKTKHRKKQYQPNLDTTMILMGACAAGNGIHNAPQIRLSPKQEQLMFAIFQACIHLLHSSDSTTLQYEQVVHMIQIIDMYTVVHIEPPLACLKRTIKYLQVRTEDNLPYLTILSDIQSRNTSLSFQDYPDMMKSIDFLIDKHHNSIEQILQDNDDLESDLTEEERDTFEWAQAKVGAGSIISKFAAMCMEKEGGDIGSMMMPQSVERDLDATGKLCHSWDCYNHANLKLCSACKQVWYCGVSCQRKDWSKHKVDCKKARGKQGGK